MNRANGRACAFSPGTAVADCPPGKPLGHEAPHDPRHTPPASPTHPLPITRHLSAGPTAADLPLHRMSTRSRNGSVHGLQRSRSPARSRCTSSAPLRWQPLPHRPSSLSHPHPALLGTPPLGQGCASPPLITTATGPPSAQLDAQRECPVQGPDPGPEPCGSAQLLQLIDQPQLPAQGPQPRCAPQALSTAATAC